MASTVTLASLRLQAQQRADQVNSSFLTTAEWNTNINASATELYDLLTTVYSDYYFNTYSFTTTSADTYPLPSDFYKLVGVDQIINPGTGQSISLKPYNFQERNSYTQFVGAATPMRLHYVPVMTKLVADADTFDGINGYEEYIVIDAAIKAMTKEESDTSQLKMDKEAMRKRIIDSAPPRDASKSDRITDIHQVDPFYYVSVPARYRYRLLGNNLKLVQAYSFGTIYE